MFLWIDPPGTDPGWIHELESADDIPAVLAQYSIPADNTARQATYDQAHEGEPAEQYQSGRDFWGITSLAALPTDLPADVVMVLTGEPRRP